MIETPDSIDPAHLDAILQERFLRNAACLGLNRNVGGYELRPMTVRSHTILRLCRSPYLPPFKTPSPDETLAFLWLQSPEYVIGDGVEAQKARRDFYRQKFDFIPPLPPYFLRTRLALGKHAARSAHALGKHAELVKLLRDHVSEIFQDAPPPVHKSGILQPEYYCDAVAVCTMLAREFGGGLMAYFDLPLELLFQAMKEMNAHHAMASGKPPILFNQSDAIDDEKLEAMNRELHASGRPMHPAAQPFMRN